MFVPMPGAMALSESLLGLAPLTTPLQWLGASPVTAHNVAFLLSTPLAAWGAWRLVSRLTPRTDAAFLAALAFAFAPYRLGQLSHLQVLFSCWMPFALASAHDFLGQRTKRPLVYLAIFWCINGLTNGYYLAYFPALMGLWMLWFVRDRRAAFSLTAALAVGSLPWLPLLYGYQIRQAALGLSRGINEIRQFSADFSALLAGSPRAWLSSHWTLAPKPEGELYPGLAIVIVTLIGLIVAWRSTRTPATTAVPARGNRWLAAAAIVLALTGLAILLTGGAKIDVGALAVNAKRANRVLSIALVLGGIALARSTAMRRAWATRSPLVFYALAGVVMFLLALGPEPKAWGRDLLYRAPYWWLMQLPGLDSVRVPARFGQLMIVALAPALALAYAKLFPARHRAAWIVSVALLAEGWVPALPVALLPASPVVPAQARAAGAAVLELPVDDDFAPNTRALLNAMRHGMPLVNGFGGYIPAHYHVLRLGLEDADGGVLEALRAYSPIATYIHRAEDAGGRLKALVAALPSAAALGSDSGGDWFLLPSVPAAPVSAGLDELEIRRVRTSSRADAAALMLDRNPQVGWHSERKPGTNDQVDLEFGQPVTVSELELSLGPWTGNYPRDLEISTVAGDRVTPVWRGSVAGLALRAALTAKDIPIRIPLPAPVVTSALRLTNIWRDNNPDWSIALVRALGRRNDH